MATRNTVSEMISNVRIQTNEISEIAIEDSDIIAIFNQGQEIATEQLVRQYPEPLLTQKTYTISSDGPLFDIPRDAWAQRIQQVEIVDGSNYHRIPRISYHDAVKYEGPSVAYPAGYYVLGRHWKFAPANTGYAQARVWYVKEPDELVEEQGQITTINTANNYVYVGVVGDDLSASTDSLASYVNLIDGLTGELKGTLQIQSISGTKITFKSTPFRTTVLNKTVTGSLSTLGATEDDYICLAKGTCIPFMKNPLGPLLVEYAVFRIKNRNMDPIEADRVFYDKLQREFEGTWSGRETRDRVRRRNGIWRRMNRPVGYYSGGNRNGRR